MTVPPGDVVVVAVRVAAPVDRVWRALADADDFAEWFWPARFATEAVFDVRPGGAYQVRSTGLPEGQNMGVTGRFVEVRPSDRLVMTWRWDGEDEETTVTIEIAGPGDDGSEVTVTQAGLASSQERENHAAGWRSCLDRLAARLGQEG
jgi:uncharacterized protein YndB with AHSA1/START domain